MSLTREQALKDCKALWRYLSMSGVKKTFDVIDNLYHKKILSQKSYSFNCPLCEIYYFAGCTGCPWPKYSRIPMRARCEFTKNSPYHYYYNILKAENYTRIESQKLASAVYKLVKTFK